MADVSVFYNLSGGMESAVMVYLERERIRKLAARVIWANTGKYVGDMTGNIRQISQAIGSPVIEVPRRISFDEFLWERGGMIRKGTTDCSRRMKRSNLSRYINRFARPWEVNLGFNRDEQDRAERFMQLNEKPWCHWRFPLIEANLSRSQSWEICRQAKFSILLETYERLGRWDCFWCGNQTPEQARKLHKLYPDAGQEWIEAERKKGHSFMPVFQTVLIQPRELPLFPQTKCACFGGEDEFLLDEKESVSDDSPAHGRGN